MFRTQGSRRGEQWVNIGPPFKGFESLEEAQKSAEDHALTLGDYLLPNGWVITLRGATKLPLSNPIERTGTDPVEWECGTMLGFRYQVYLASSRN
jgi:hypothetical protein